jgi:integrase
LRPHFRKHAVIFRFLNEGKAMKGHIRQRGKHSWRLKFDAERDTATRKRKIQYVTFRGTKREAQNKLAELIAAVGKGSYVEPSRTTVAEFLPARVDQWEAAGAISARTAQRYRQLIENQIMPHLGAKPLQRLRPLDIEEWHTTLLNGGRVRGNGGIAARTVAHAHRVLSKALKDAAKNGLVSRNVAKEQATPKVEDGEVAVVQNVPALVERLREWRLGTVAMVALFTGMRLGEVLALRWNRVHLDSKVAKVRDALEQTRAHGIRFKPPKSKAGRRDISLPDILIDALREHRKAMLELRMQLGAGKLPDNALLFATIYGEPLSPNAVSAAWADFCLEVTFHALRHTHASQLIDAGVDIVTISKRLGHAKPDITLRIYAHLFKKDDSKAAAAINASLGS